MEEKPKPRSRALLVACLLVGTLAGFLGGLQGAAISSPRALMGLSEHVFLTVAMCSPALGAALGFLVWRLQPRRDTWEGCLGWFAMLAADGLGTWLLSGGIFYVVARLMKS